eukprot:scaffold238205_cov52-Prasinocladus_malaysianus.AAC.1
MDCLCEGDAVADAEVLKQQRLEQTEAFGPSLRHALRDRHKPSQRRLPAAQHHGAKPRLQLAYEI